MENRIENSAPEVDVYELETLEFTGHRNRDGTLMALQFGLMDDWPDAVWVKGSDRSWRFRLNDSEEGEIDEGDPNLRPVSVAWYVNE